MPDSRHDIFSRLFLESRTTLRHYVRRFVRSRETADEIVQESFLRAYEHARPNRSPMALLYSIARNLATDHHRHERVARTETVGDFDASPVIPEGESLEARMLAEEEARLLKDATEQLPPQCRMAFALRVFHGHSYKEIAEKLGISDKTVENHVSRGIRDTHRYLRQRYQGRASK